MVCNSPHTSRLQGLTIPPVLSKLLKILFNLSPSRQRPRVRAPVLPAILFNGLLEPERPSKWFSSWFEP